MAFNDDKKGIFDELSTFKTLSDLPKGESTSSLESVNSKSKNILPFLLDLLKASIQEKVDKAITKNKSERDAKKAATPEFSEKPKDNSLEKKNKKKDKKKGGKFKELIKEIFNQFLPELTTIIKQSLFDAIKEALSCGSDFKLPSGSFIVDIEKIDYNNILKTDPSNNSLGGIFFGGPDDLNRFIYEVIQNNSNSFETWMGILDIKFLNGLDVPEEPKEQLEIKLNPNYSESTFDDFFKDYLDKLELFDKKTIMGTLIDKIFSNVTSLLENSLDQLVNEGKTDALMDKVLRTDPCYDEVVFDDSFFTFSNEELESIERKARERKSGLIPIDLGCGIFEFNINDDSVGNNIFSLLDSLDSDNDPQKQEDITVNLLNNVGDVTSDLSPEDSDSIRDKIDIDFILELPKVLIKNSILSPKVLLVYNFCNFMVNKVGNEEVPKNSFDWSKFNKTFFESLVRESLAVLVEVIFDVLKRELSKLIQKVVTKIVKNIAKKKIGILLSFIPGSVSGSLTGAINKLPTPQVEDYI